MFNQLVTNQLILTAVLCFVVQLVCWLWQIKTKNTDIVDIGWALLIVICGLVYFLNGNGDRFHLNMILLIPILWYWRLAWHLIGRYQVKHEDGRYQALRQHWSQSSNGILQLKLLAFFLFQAALAWLFSYPAYIISNLQQSFGLQDIFALILLAVSFIGITLSDWQLAKFKKNKSTTKQVCDLGFWKYSRHPNYFFEWLHWFCYPLLGLSINTLFTLDGVILLASPLIMLLFLLKLTGIPFNEEQNIRSKGDAYIQYQKKTNMFFLRKPKPLEESS